ncbi:TsaC protein [Clostridiaceae bacterium JG1575]|nr:TsaC protein [Clostridiaceae bacterium JG1575]
MEGSKVKQTRCIDLTGASKESRARALKQAGDILRSGGTVAFPTETVYGLGADGLSAAAVLGIFEAKGRPSDNPLILHVASRELTGLVREVPEAARPLMEAFWPGPLTLVFHKDPRVPDETTGGLPTVGIRMPAKSLALELIEATGRPLAAPSANRSGRPSPTTYERCVEDLLGRVDLILGEGSCAVGLESTILDLTVDPPEILRPGAITQEMLELLIGPLAQPAPLKKGEPPRAPGMKYRHYAPTAEVELWSGPRETVRRAMQEAADTQCLLVFIDEQEGAACPQGTALKGSIALRAPKDSAQGRQRAKSLVHYANVQAASKDLFELFRAADDQGIRRILLQGVLEKGLGRSLMNRIRKAASREIILP